MNDLFELLEFEAKEISLLFEKASIEGRGTPQEVSDRRENALQIFLQKYFPFPYRVTKGNIIDSYSNRSNSIDCLLLSPKHPFTTTDEKTYSIIFADGVDLAIELKPDLSNESEIRRGLSQIRSVKKLRRKNHGLLMTSKLKPEYIDTAKQIPGIVFCNTTYVNIETTLTKVVQYYISEKIPRNERCDIIVINDRGLILNFGNGLYLDDNNLDGVYYKELNEKTLMAFLFLVNTFPQSDIRSSSSVLKTYLENPISGNLIEMKELNEEMRKIN